MATITLTVTVSNPGSGNKYYIDGVLQATVSMIPGNTYKFDQADNSNSGHPLRLSTTSDGSHNSGSEYTTGVTTSGTPGSSGAYTQIEVTVLTVQSLYYYCTSHSGMGGAINVGNSSTLGLKEMSGFPIQNLTADPVPFAQAKTNDPYAGAWASGGNMNTARFLTGGAGSSNSAALAFGGRTPSPADVALTENYNGTAWTEVGDLPAVKSYAAGAGTSTAALSIGGSSPAVPATSGKTESWNGSSWTEITALGRGPTSPQSTTYGAGSGSTTSALFYASDEATNVNARTESWNGSSWTELADQNTGRSYGAGVGTSNSSALLAGGLIYPPASANTEIWNGSSWTEVGDMNQARFLYNTSSGQGSATLALIYSGRLYPPNASSALTESWDGTSWTEVNDLSTARRAGSGGGTATSAILGGGSTSGSSPGHVATTEEWAFSGIAPDAPAVGYSDAIVGQMYYNSTSGQFKVIKDGGAPIGTWASGGNLNAARGNGIGGGGTQTNALAFGGDPRTAATENYNGSSWTEVSDLNTARNYLTGIGESGEACMANSGNSGSYTGATEIWNGSSWTEVADTSPARIYVNLAGSTTSAIQTGGSDPSYPNGNAPYAQEWDGSSWTEVTEMNTPRYAAAGFGANAEAANIAGGSSSGGPGNASNELWNGSSWTELSDLNTARYNLKGFGVSTQGIAAGGAGPASANLTGKTEFWNGSTWTEVNDMATSRRGLGSGTGSPSNAGIVFGGNSPPAPAVPNSNATEEWTAEDFTINPVTTS